jgi:very-short-patch-repair endonuclease
VTTALQTAATKLAKEQKRAKREALELAMLLQIKAVKLEAGLSKQHRFHPDRKWAFDFAWPARRWALEVEGGTWTGGRHTRGEGFRDDCEKYAQAALKGWRVLRATSDQVTGGIAIKWLEEALLPKAMPSLLAGLDEHEPGDLAHAKEDAVRSPTYLANVRRLLCANCGLEGMSEAAHVNRGKGMSIKAPDNHTMPLCSFRRGSKADCHGRYDLYQLGDKHQSADMGEAWALNTYDTLKRMRMVPMGVPRPKFQK